MTSNPKRTNTPKSDNPYQVSKNQAPSSSQRTWLLIGAIGLTILFAVTTGNLYTENLKLKQQLSQKPDTPQITTTTNQPTPTSEPETPNFESRAAKELNTFDTSTWETFEDNDIGLRFRYPPAWGNPQIKLDSCAESCSSDDVTPAWIYRVEFPNSQFTVGGGSENWAPSRGANILYDFNGFVEDDSSDPKLYWFNRQAMCSTPWLLSCEIGPGKVTYTASLACRGETGSGFDYERVLLLDVINDTPIRGVALGGNFIPKNSETAELVNCDEEIKSSIDQALINRKLDPETMKTFDRYTAVFETVEIY